MKLYHYHYLENRDIFQVKKEAAHLKTAFISYLLRKTHTEISSSNHNRETTFKHWEKSFIQSEISGQFATHSRSRWRLFNHNSQKFVEFPQVYYSFLIQEQQSK